MRTGIGIGTTVALAIAIGVAALQGGGGSGPATYDCGAGRSFFVDYVGGLDANAGSSTAAPWKRAPGMVGFTGTYVHQNGDCFYFKGGVAWPSAVFTWNFVAGGISGTKDYYGPKGDWFTGGSWARPILDGEGTFGNAGAFVVTDPYVIFDNFEFKGMHWTGSPAFGTATYFDGRDSGCGWEIRNSYFHGWTHAAGGDDSGTAILGDSQFPTENCDASASYNVIDGADGDKISLHAIFLGPPLIHHNVIRHVADAVVLNDSASIHHNLIEHVARSYNATAHGNGYESNFDGGLDGLYFYSNVVRQTDDVLAGSQAAAGVNLWFAPCNGQDTYVFNNVTYDTTPANVIDLAAPVGGCPDNGDELFFVNNTVYCGTAGSPSATCIGACVGNGVYTIRNNHFVTSAADPQAGSGCETVSDNLTQTLATANGQGYTTAQTFALAPTDAADGTVDTGVNLSSLCVSEAAALCSDTEYGVAYDEASHKVLASPRSSNARPGAGAWDIGAYHWP